MADRKKVRRIRPKRTIKFKPTRTSSVSKDDAVKKEAESINMEPNDDETPVRPSHPRSQKTKREAGFRSNKAPSRGDNTPNRKKGDFSVISGKKGEIQKRRLVTFSVSLILILSVIIFWLTSPTGPIERITNAFAIMGSEEYPAVLTGTKVGSLQTENNKVFLLTNSHLCGYNYSGKNFLSLQHNFSNPVLDVSQERVLVYNRESNKFLIANNSGSIFEESLDQSIYCADISNNGSVALVSNSASYAAQITVFDKNMKQYYTWYLADGLVSDITVSNDGDYVALAVLKVENGMFSSEIYCLDTSEKEPLFRKELKDETVLKIESVSSSNFVYTSDKSVSFVEWKTGEIINKNSFSAPAYFNKISDYYLAQYGEANHSDIVLYNSSGEVEHQFDFNGIIDDITIFDKTVFILSGNKVTYFNFSDKNKNVINLDSKPDYIIGMEKGFVSINNINMNFISINSEN